MPGKGFRTCTPCHPIARLIGSRKRPEAGRRPGARGKLRVCLVLWAESGYSGGRGAGESARLQKAVGLRGEGCAFADLRRG